MYTKITRYIVAIDKKEEFLDIQQEMADIFLNSMGGRMQFLRNQLNEEEWLGLHQVESKELYERRLEEVREQLAEAGIHDRLAELLLSSVEEDPQSDYYMYMEIVSED